MPKKAAKKTTKAVAPKLKAADLDRVRGGMTMNTGTGGVTAKRSVGSDSCKETTDTGMMGCTG